MIRRLNQLKQDHDTPTRTAALSLLSFVLLCVFLFNLTVGASVGWSQEAPLAEMPAGVEMAGVDPPPADFLGVPLWDDDIYKMVVRFAFNLFFVLLVVGIAYRSNNASNQRYLFNFLIMNVVVFFICFTLKKLELELGMALGLFAIFAIIRYRTDQIDVKDMTYLFVVIGLAVINSLSNKKTSYVELVFTNAVVFAACLVMERVLGPAVKKVKLTRSEVVYEKLDLLRPENVKELYEDLYQRTGIRADRVEIKQIDFKNGTSLIDIRQSKARAFAHQEEVASAKLD